MPIIYTLSEIYEMIGIVFAIATTQGTSSCLKERLLQIQKEGGEEQCICDECCDECCEEDEAECCEEIRMETAAAEGNEECCEECCEEDDEDEELRIANAEMCDNERYNYGEYEDCDSVS